MCTSGVTPMGNLNTICPFVDSLKISLSEHGQHYDIKRHIWGCSVWGVSHRTWKCSRSLESSLDFLSQYALIMASAVLLLSERISPQFFRSHRKCIPNLVEEQISTIRFPRSIQSYFTNRAALQTSSSGTSNYDDSSARGKSIFDIVSYIIL